MMMFENRSEFERWDRCYHQSKLVTETPPASGPCLPRTGRHCTTHIIIVASCGGRYAPQVFLMVMVMARPSNALIDHCWPPSAMFSSLSVLGAFQAKWQRQWQNCGHSGWMHFTTPVPVLPEDFHSVLNLAWKKTHFLSTSKTPWIFWI